MNSPKLTDGQAATLAEAVANAGTLYAATAANRKILDHLARKDLVRKVSPFGRNSRYEVTGGGWAVHAVLSGLAAAIGTGGKGESRG